MLDPERSEVRFEGSSSIHPIHSTGPARGEIDVDAGSGWIEVALKELRSGNPLYDREIRRRLDAQRHPTIRGELTGLTAVDGDRYAATGTVTVRDADQEVSGELAIREDADGSVSIAGERAFDLRDFGLDPPNVFGLKVHPEVVVRLAAVGLRPPRGEPAVRPGRAG